MGQKDKQERFRELGMPSEAGGMPSEDVGCTRSQTCWSLIRNVFGLFLEWSIPLFCPGENWVKWLKAQQKMNHYLSTVASQGVLFKLCCGFVLISSVNVIIVSLDFQVSYELPVIHRVYGILCPSSCKEATTITQGTTAGGFLLPSSFCEIYITRCKTQWPGRSLLAPKWFFLSWYLRMWYVISHNTTVSSTSSDSPPVLQPIMGRIGLQKFDEKRKSAFVLVLPYLPLEELKT